MDLEPCEEMLQAPLLLGLDLLLLEDLLLLVLDKEVKPVLQLAFTFWISTTTSTRLFITTTKERIWI
nr:hypothetical protein Q903MT_gene1922 [Picea sitchensis]